MWARLAGCSSRSVHLAASTHAAARTKRNQKDDADLRNRELEARLITRSWAWNIREGDTVQISSVKKQTNHKQSRALWTVAVILLVAAACGEPGGSTRSGGETKTAPALKLAVLDAVGGSLAYCYPDQFPVARGNPLEVARERFPEIRADDAAFTAILDHQGLSDDQRFTPDQLIAINEDYKQMQAIDLRPGEASGGYKFVVLSGERDTGGEITRVSGTVTNSGSVTIVSRERAAAPECPICLPGHVRIATPEGGVPVRSVSVGMQIWTLGRHGDRVAGVVLETGTMKAPVGHEVARLTLADGRTLEASPGHPTADGRAVGDLGPGDRYDGSVVMSATLKPYVGATWDILVSGATGSYFANGVLLESSLAKAVRGS
jgi:hypothetical protein